VDGQLKAQLGQTIYYAAPASVSSGKYTYSTATSAAARVEMSTDQTRGTDTGETAGHRVITEAAIGMNYRLWLPGDARTDALARVVQSVKILVDENGTEYGRVVYL